MFTPIQIEALAAREGLVLAVHRGFYGISLESDSLQIVLALHGSSTDVSPIGPSIEDAKFLLQLIAEATTSHMRHQSNSVVQGLARFALHSR